jgi:hypothetical protein
LNAWLEHLAARTAPGACAFIVLVEPGGMWYLGPRVVDSSAMHP